MDNGAVQALKEYRRSLLPKGIIDVQSQFLRGQVIDIVDCQGKIIARGLCNYSSEEIKLIKGHNTSDIEDILHYKDYDEVVHANNMVIIGG